MHKYSLIYGARAWSGSRAELASRGQIWTAVAMPLALDALKNSLRSQTSPQDYST